MSARSPCAGASRIADQLRRPGLPDPAGDHLRRLHRRHAGEPARTRRRRVAAAHAADAEAGAPAAAAGPGHLEEVSPRARPDGPRPEITRLNARYAAALSLAELILPRDLDHARARRGRLGGLRLRHEQGLRGLPIDRASERARAPRRARAVPVQRQAPRPRRPAHASTPTSPGGPAGHAGRSSTPSTRSSRYPAFPTPTRTRCSPTAPRSVWTAATWSYAKDAGQEPVDHLVSGTGTCIHVRAIDVEREPADVLSKSTRSPPR